MSLVNRPSGMLYRGETVAPRNKMVPLTSCIKRFTREQRAVAMIKEDLVYREFNYLVRPVNINDLSTPEEADIAIFQQALIRSNGPILINFNEGEFSVITITSNIKDIANACRTQLVLKNPVVQGKHAKPEDLSVEEHPFNAYDVFGILNQIDEFDFDHWRFSSILATRNCKMATELEDFDLSRYTYVSQDVLKALSWGGRSFFRDIYYPPRNR